MDREVCEHMSPKSQHCDKCRQPTALRLADILETDAIMDWIAEVGRYEAAAELRRLHQSEREGWRYADELEKERKQLQAILNQERSESEALLRQALEKLENLRVTIDSEWGECRDLEQIDAEGDQWPVVIALRERLGENT